MWVEELIRDESENIIAMTLLSRLFSSIDEKPTSNQENSIIWSEFKFFFPYSYINTEKLATWTTLVVYSNYMRLWRQSCPYGGKRNVFSFSRTFLREAHIVSREAKRWTRKQKISFHLFLKIQQFSFLHNQKFKLFNYNSTNWAMKYFL